MESSLAGKLNLPFSYDIRLEDDEDRFVATPNYFVFEMYAAHQGGRNIRTVFSVPDVHYSRDGEPASFWGLNGSASQKDNVVTLTVVNPDLKQPKETQVDLRGAAIARTATVIDVV